MYYTSSRRKHFSIDTAALCDVAFVLLSFFILSWKTYDFNDPVRINVPLSTYTGCTLSSGSSATIIIDRYKVMFSIFPSGIREQTLKQIGKSYHIAFSRQQSYGFRKMNYIASPVYELKSQLNKRDTLSYDAITTQAGIPVEKGNNDLANWVYESRRANKLLNNNEIRFYIKADEKTDYTLIKKVISTLQSQGINKFSLLTNLKQTTYE